MGQTSARTLILMIIWTIISSSMFLFVIYLILMYIGRDKILKIVFVIIALIVFVSIPKIYFLVKKKPKIEAGEYSIDEIKED